MGWLVRLAVNGNPDFVWRLSTDVMEGECRQQTEDGVRDRRGDHGDGLELGRLFGREPVETFAEFLYGSTGYEVLESAVRNTVRRDIPWSENGPNAHFPEIVEA